MMYKSCFLKYFCISLCLILLAMILSFEQKVKYPTENFFIASDYHQKLQKTDFSNIKDPTKKKAAFIEYMLTAIEIANKEVCLEKKQIQNLKKAC